MSKTKRRFVDAHMHLWDSAANDWYAFPVPGGDDFGMNLALPKAFPDPFRLDDYLAALGDVEVVKTVHVTAVGPPAHVEAESRWISQIAKERGLPSAIIGTVDTELAHAEIEAVLDREMRDPLYRGIRFLGGLDYDSAVADVALRALAKRNLVYDAVAHPGGGIAALAGALGRYEDLVVVLEHTGWPLSDDMDTFHRWREEMTALAKVPNANVKLSGLPMFVHRTDMEIHRRYFDACLGLFGADRCMFGSNFPVDFVYTGFTDLLGVFEAVAADAGEADGAKLFGGTAERVYRI